MAMSSILIFIGLLLAVHSSPPCCDQNTLSVSGAGAVEVDPDIVGFTVTASQEGKTSAAALSEVNKLISSASSILSKFGLPTANYSTTSVRLSPIYNYTNGTSYLVGQQGSQSLQVTVGSLVKNKEIIGQIVTALSVVKSLSIDGFTFRNSDTTKAKRLARRAAVADAQSKAGQYAQLSGKGLGRVKKVVDQSQGQYIPYFMNAEYYFLQARTLKVPFGKVKVRAFVDIDWHIAA